MSLVHINVSPKQLSKLRNGHKIRIKEGIQGCGYNLLVDPLKFSLITRSFKKGKGSEIQLTEEEIESNRKLTPEYHQNIKKENSKMAGEGIFGKKFDRFVRKTIGKKAKNAIYNAADSLKPILKQGIDKLADSAPELGASALSGLALSAGQPELVPIAQIAGKKLGKLAGKKLSPLAKDYLDNPSKYQENISNFESNIGGSKSKRFNTLVGQMTNDDLVDLLNEQLGTNYGNISRASIMNSIANRQAANMMPVPISEMADSYSRYKMAPSIGYGMRKSKGIIGMKSQMVQPPALQSQPDGANYQFKNTLPPIYQQYRKTIGSGLYA